MNSVNKERRDNRRFITQRSETIQIDSRLTIEQQIEIVRREFIMKMKNLSKQ